MSRSPDTPRIDPEACTVSELLPGGAILDELRRREIVRSANNPISDYAELLFCKAYSWTRENNSAAGYDATDQNKVRYQIKARRLTPNNRSRQLSAIRKLDEDPFDVLAGVLFDDKFLVLKAILLPIAAVRARAVHVLHTNSWKFLLRDDVWNEPGAQDVTKQIRKKAAAF